MGGKGVSENGAVEFEDAVAYTGFGKYNIILLIVCGISLMSVIMETLSMSYILPAAQCDLNLSLSDKGLLSSVGFLGVVLSSLLWGFIGDTAGRRNVVLITSYISFLMGIISSLSPYVWMLIVFRFLNCFFIGGPSAVVIAYLGEFHSGLYRSRVISWSATFVAIASIILPGFAWSLLPMEWAYYVPILGITMRPWRLLIMLYGIPSFISATCLLFLPESPKFLWAVGRSDEAITILKRIYAMNTGNPEDDYPVSSLIVSKEKVKKIENFNGKENTRIVSLLKRFWVQLSPIFCPPLLLRTFMTSFLQFGVFAGSSGLLMWIPEILNKITYYMDQEKTSSVTVCRAIDYRKNLTDIDQFGYLEVEDCNDSINEDVFKLSLMIATAFALTYMIIGSVINLTGKNKLLAGLLLITGTAGMLVNFMEDYTVITILAGLYTVGGAGVTILNTAVVDLFPTQYRSIAMAVSLMAGRGGAVIACHAMGYILEYSCYSVFFILGGLFIALALFSLLLPNH